MKRQILSVLLIATTVLLTVGCEESLTGPEPGLRDPAAGEDLPVDPGIICRVQNPEQGTAVVVNGEELSPVPFDLPGDPKAALPDVALVRSAELDGAVGDAAETLFGGQPDGPNASLLTWQSQEQLTLAITDALALERGVYDVRVTNPQGAEATSAGSLAVIDKPTVEVVEPGITCLAQTERVVTVTGLEILRNGDATAEVIVGGNTYTVDQLDGCTAIAHAGLDAEICTTATITIPAGDLAAGDQPVELQNPETAACKSDPEADNIALQVVDPPMITGAQPPLICTDEAERALTLTGTNFFTVDGALPTVTVAGDPITVNGVSGCNDVEVVGLTVQNCTEISITVPQGSLTEGNPEIIVENPGPIGCSTSSSTALAIPPAVTIDSIAPSTVCQDSAGVTTLTVTGLGFLTIDGTPPAVTFDGADAAPTNFQGCTSLMVDGLAVDACTSFDIEVDLTGAAIGAKSITVTNADPSNCGATADDLFFVSGPPDVQSVLPTNICSDVTETITVTGTGFTSGSTVTVGGVAADMVTANPAGTELTATFTNGLGAGTYDVTVDNGSGCADTLAAAITVDPTPIVFFVDPPTIYDAVDFEVTIFTSGLANNAQSVTLVDSMGNRTPLTNFTSPARPNRILATVPANLPADTYEVEVTSDIGCVSVNNGTLVITDNIALTGLAVEPGFVSPTDPTAVTITVDAGTPFVSTPRAYLNPNPAGAGVSATALRAVVFQDATTLTAVVPGGLTPGQYDLTVVNPNGEVGFAPQAITVTVGEPPVIDTVVPQTFANDGDKPAELRGANFDATGGVTVDLTCEDPGGVITNPSATVNATTTDTIDVTMPTGALVKGTICLVTVTNADGASFAYSAISVTNPSFNLEPWAAVSSMSTPRRGLGLVAGRPTNTSRFLYAVGGDSGSTAGALASVESVAVNVFGDLQAWRPERYALPTPKTLAGIERVGRFVYLVGGNDGTAASNTVYRAQVLDPLETPEVVDIDAQLGDGANGLGEGLYHYRISAIFDGTDASNPNGESLPGEVTIVDLPAVQDLITLTLTWNQVPGASGYRIYRTPNAGDSIDDLQLLAEVSGTANTSFIDDGATTDPTAVPLAEGSLGTWHAAGTLNTPRESTTAIAAPHPTDPNTVYLYAFGGRDGGTYLSSFEYSTITIAADGSQTVGPWTTGTASLADAKAELGSVSVNNDQSATIPAGETWIYVGPGRTGTGFTGNVESFQVVAGGDVTAFTNLNRAVSTTRAGYGMGASSDFIYIFGAQGASASNDGISAEFTAPTTLRPGAWNSLGISMTDARIFMGTARESAFYFIAGGTDGTNALSSVDQTVQ